MYLRWPRFIAFHLTSALCIVVVGLSSWGLKVAHDKKKFVSESIPGASLNLTDVLGTGGALTAASGVCSLIILGMNLLAHFRPNMKETLHTVRIKEGLFAFICVLWLATLIPATVIYATKAGVVTKPGVSDAVIKQIVALSGQSLAYKDQIPVRAYTFVGWAAFGMSLLNLVLVSLAARHALKHPGVQGNIGALVGHHETIKEGADIDRNSSVEKPRVSEV